MPRYFYSAHTGTGEIISNHADAPSLPALGASLAISGLKLRSAREISAKAPHLRLPYYDVIGIYRQLGSSLEAGLPLTETLGMLGTESRNLRMKALLHYLKVAVSEGTPLSEAMGSIPKVFPRIHVAAIKAGEESGQLEQTMSELADQAEAMSNMNRKFASSLVYPAVVAFVALGLLVFAFTAIVPNFQTMFGDLGIMELPTPTKLVFFIAQKVLPVGVMLIVAVLVMTAIVLTQRRAASGRLWLDTCKLRLPVVGQVVEKAALARFSGTMGLLLASGIDLPRAVRLASEGAGNRTVEHLLKNLAAEIELGHTLSESMAHAETLPPTLAWRIGIGEETGTLADAMVRMGKLYTEQVNSLLITLSGLLEPVLIIIVGSGVGLLVLGMLLPLLSVIQALSSGGGQ